MENSGNNFDIITIQNVDTEPFEIIYDGKSYGAMQPQQVRRIPRFLAEHALKHLIDQILNHQDIRTDNLTKRKEWAGQIVINEEQYEEARPLTGAEKLQQEVDKLNDTSDLDNILNKKRQKSKEELELENVAPPAPVTVNNPLPTPEVPPVVPPVDTPPAEVPPVQPPVVENPTPAPTTEVAPVQQPEVTPVTDTPPVVPTEPTREQLLDYARNTLKMNLDDPKTMQTMQDMPIQDLMTELNYENNV